jgi:hypothetical protein
LIDDLPTQIRAVVARLGTVTDLLVDDAPSWLSSIYTGENLMAFCQEHPRQAAYWFIDQGRVGE